MQKFIRAVIGTNSIDGRARVLSPPTAFGMQRTSVQVLLQIVLKTQNHTEAIMVIGAKSIRGHPVTGANFQFAMKGKTIPL
ncbi:MAG: hypothetical protein IPQ04_15450 [Saprospiraceae bacterium]|nr:hypothetical protein [Saprospiraceae bacterium]